MSDDLFAKYEAEMADTPHVYGTAVDIMETYAALVWAASTFGLDCRKALLAAVWEAHPILGEIESTPTEGPEFDDVHDRYFGDETKYAATIDIVADAVLTAQEWLATFMEARSIPELNLLIPRIQAPTVRFWKFGKARLSDLTAAGLDIAATHPVEE